MNITKAQKKHLRKLAGIGYERDLSRCLVVVKENFEEWENGEITVWDLNDKIHEYHSEIARALYKTYTMTDPAFPVAFAIKQGVLTIEEVNEDCRQLLQGLLEYLNEDEKIDA